MKIKIGKKIISNQNPTYFIADIAANHDGSLLRAKKLIRLVAKAGADAAKFQHFKAETIVNDKGFKKTGKVSHQSKWKKSVFEVYKRASINPKWTKILKKECDKYKIEFLTSPYDMDYVDEVDKYIKAYKIGSGDITWLDIIKKISKKNKPVILATGASTLKDVHTAYNLIRKYNSQIVLMQCNTNYTANEENFKYINLKVLNKFKKKFKNTILGLSDHTLGHATVLGAIAMGVRVVEKHFTDDNGRLGPDHKFSMNPKTWNEMIVASRQLESSMGDGEKKIEKNEIKTAILQRRSYVAKKNILLNEKITKKNVFPLRPALKGSPTPNEDKKLFNKRSKKLILKGEHLEWKNLK